MGVSFETAEIVLEILSTTPGFNSEVYDWSRRIRRIFTGPYLMENREIMKEWWKANEQFFREQNYAAVQPGREPQNPFAETTATQAPAPTSNLAATPALPNSTPPPVGPTAIAAADSPTPTAATLWTCAAAAIALLVSLVVFWKRRA